MDAVGAHRRAVSKNQVRLAVDRNAVIERYVVSHKVPACQSSRKTVTGCENRKFTLRFCLCRAVLINIVKGSNKEIEGLGKAVAALAADSYGIYALVLDLGWTECHIIVCPGCQCRVVVVGVKHSRNNADRIARIWVYLRNITDTDRVRGHFDIQSKRTKNAIVIADCRQAVASGGLF